MPELPDVEVYRRYLEETSLGRRVETVHVRDDRLLEVSASTLRRHLKGARLASARRHGKLLFVELAGADRWLLLHFGMTGALSHYEEGEEPEDVAVLLDFEDGSHLAYRNRRTFGRVGLVEEVDEAIEAERLGPDPTADGFDLRDFRDVLDGRSGTIKGLLMNQKALAGLGNIYADEALFRAGLHPETPADSLSDDQVKALWGAVKYVIEKAVDAGAEVDAMPSTWLIQAREEGADCPRCDGTVEKTKVGGRSTYWCPACQERPDG